LICLDIFIVLYSKVYMVIIHAVAIHTANIYPTL
jgi:hypothetical protein